MASGNGWSHWGLRSFILVSVIRGSDRGCMQDVYSGSKAKINKVATVQTITNSRKGSITTTYDNIVINFDS